MNTQACFPKKHACRANVWLNVCVCLRVVLDFLCPACLNLHALGYTGFSRHNNEACTRALPSKAPFLFWHEHSNLAPKQLGMRVGKICMHDEGMSILGNCEYQVYCSVWGTLYQPWWANISLSSFYEAAAPAAGGQQGKQLLLVLVQLLAFVSQCSTWMAWS
jgi:hypothetical protein